MTLDVEFLNSDNTFGSQFQNTLFVKGENGKSAYDIWLELGNTGSEVDFINSLKGAKGDSGDKGDTGAAGVSVTKTEINQRGELVITLSDNTVSNLGVVVGAKGDKGDKGDQGEQGIQGIQGIQGETGAKGDKGDKGRDGIGVASIEINDEGELVVTLSDDSVKNLGLLGGNSGIQLIIWEEED